MYLIGTPCITQFNLAIALKFLVFKFKWVKGFYVRLNIPKL